MSWRRSVFRWATVTLVGCTFAGCSGEPTVSTQFEPNKVVFATAREATRLTLYEGLPHQMFEATQLANELKTKATVTLHGFPFYQETLHLKEEDAARLKAALGDEGSFEPYGGPKKCGGFHPDYCAEWEADGLLYRCLICFGCTEVKVYGPGRALHCDIRPEVEKNLEKLLKPYRKSRPEQRPDE
jgi:hypothetical protein